MRDIYSAGTMSTSSRKTIIGSIAVSIAFVMELTLVPLLLPSIQEQFGLSITELAWVFNAYGVAVALGVLIGGWFGDVYDTRKVFGLGVFFFALGSTVTASAGTYETMIVGRIMQGFGGGIFSPLVPILLTRAAPDRPGKVLIVWGSIAGYIAASAPFFYSNVLVDYGWNLAFIIFAAVSVVALAVVLKSDAAEDPDDTAKEHPHYARLLESRDIWVLFAYVFCTYGTITYYLFRLPLWLSENKHSVVSIGLTLSILWLSFSFMSTLLRNHVDAPRIRRILTAAPAFIAAGFTLGYMCDDLSCLMLSSVLVGCGLACSNAPSTQLILEFAPKGMSAVSASMDITFARLGGVVAVTYLAQSDFVVAVISAVTFCLIAGICAIALGKRLKTTP